MRRYGGLGEDATRQDAATTQRAAILMSPCFMDLSLGPFPGLEPAGRTRLGVFLCRFVDLRTRLLVRLASVLARTKSVSKKRLLKGKLC